MHGWTRVSSDLWERSHNGWTASLWEVAERDGLWQWSAMHDDDSYLTDDHWYEWPESAQESAEQAIGLR